MNIRTRGVQAGWKIRETRRMARTFFNGCAEHFECKKKRKFHLFDNILGHKLHHRQNGLAENTKVHLATKWKLILVL
jgi:hypothetical protein